MRKRRSGAAEAALDKADYESLAEFRYLLRQFAAFSQDAAQAADLTPQQHQALLAIKGFPGREQASIGELAERLNIRHHSVVGLVDRLVDKGLLRRHIDAADRRRVQVGLTAKAQTLLARLTRAHREELRRLAPLLQTLLKQVEQGS
jgi:DNA-binding MarR family transcriptional regulator